MWWSATDSGKLALTVRYGSRLLEFSKGKAAVEIAYRRHEPAGDVCARAYEHAKRNGKRGAK
jgi:hypothetical protein